MVTIVKIVAILILRYDCQKRKQECQRRAGPALRQEQVDRKLSETIMVSIWLPTMPTMPTTLTLKNIPDELYKRLKASAEAHRRSLNSEAIVCLESALLPERIALAERLARARALRNSLPKDKFQRSDIDLLKREGRP